MFDAAIPSEAIDETLRAETAADASFDKYVPTERRDFTNVCWAANWHRWFVCDPDDARGQMGWPGHFTAALANAVEVFKHKGRDLVRDELKKGQYLVFRTRTETYPDGTLKSAHYGVIMGNWKFFERYGMSISKILFNPTPNDTNLEDAETARLSRLGYKQRMDFERSRKEMP